MRTSDRYDNLRDDSITAFCRLDGKQQLEILAESAVWLCEGGDEDSTSLYCAFSGFYVEILFCYQPIPCIRVVSFTANDPTFAKLLEAVPVNIDDLLQSAA